MNIISKKYINKGFNSKAYIVNDNYILLEGVNHNSFNNYLKYEKTISQIGNIKSLEIPKIIELVKPNKDYPFGALIYKMIKGHSLKKEHIKLINIDSIAKKIAEFMNELYNIKVEFNKDEYVDNELEITRKSVEKLKKYLDTINYEKSIIVV